MADSDNSKSNWYLVGRRNEKEWPIGGDEKQGPPPTPVTQSVGEKTAFTGEGKSGSRVLRGLPPFSEEGEGDVLRRLSDGGK